MKNLLILIFVFTTALSKAQFFIGKNCVSSNNSVITINNMDFENTGYFNNSGELDINGNFVNNALFTSDDVFPSIILLSLDWTNNSVFSAGKSKVILKGNEQNLSGTAITTFNKLDLKGNTGNKKTMQSSIICRDTLSISNIEFATNGNELKIMNSNIPIQRNLGYISTNYKGIVKTYFQSSFVGNVEMPLGYGIGKFKPVYIINPPKDSFSFTLFGNSQLSEGMNPKSLQDSLCELSELYYFKIQTYSSPLFYGITKSISENEYSKLSRWNGSLWEKISNSGKTDLLTFENLSLNSQNPNIIENISLALEKPFVNAGSNLYLGVGMSDTIITKGYFPLNSNILWTPSTDLSCSDCQSPIFTMGTPGFYIINVTNSNVNCSASDTIIISLTKDYKNLLPNVFSPNRDNLNDTFGPVLFQDDKLEILKIFNKRWQLLYEGNTNWDGKINGEIAQDGVYYYQMEILSDETGKGDYKKIKFEGDVTLIK